MRSTRFFTTLILLAMCLPSIGCMARTDRGAEAVYTTAPWIVYSLIALGVLMLPIGVLVVRRKEPMGARLLGSLLLTLAPLLCWLAAWAASRQYVILTDAKIEFKSGALGQVKVLRFADCQGFEFQIREVTGDRGKQEESVVPVATLKDGQRMEMDYPVLRGQVLDDLIERLKKAGVSVSGQRRGL